MLAAKEAYRANLFHYTHWWRNIIAGVIVGVVALPLAMAFAIATGVKPEQGLYTAIIAAVIVGVFGGSRVQIAGPTGAFIVILANITAHYGVDGLQVATLLAGFILIFMGIIRLGSVIKFIPDPVIVGFTTGIGVIIFVGEWKDFFGLSLHLPLDMHFYQKCFILLKSLPELNWTTTGLGLFSLILLILTPKLVKHVPGPLVALIAATCIQTFFKFNDVATLGTTFGGIPNKFPPFHFPSLSVNQVLDLIAPAFTIALLGAIESLLSATAADGMAGTRHHSNQELIGQGLANILAPLFGGFAATGAIARTATNIRSGGNSPIAAIVHSIFLLLIMLLLAPLAANIPLCTLAAILFVVAYNMSDIPHFIGTIKHAPSYDVMVLLATFLLTVFVNLVVAVNVGVILAMLFFIRRMHQLVDVEMQKEDQLSNELTNYNLSSLPKDTIVYSIQGPFFFGVAEKIEHALSVTHEDPKVIIFRLKNVPFMDMTGLETFHEIINQYHKRHVKIYLCEANVRIANKLKNIDILPLVEEQRIFETLIEILQSLKT
ncbi:MAG: hypothetical protein ACD_60C00005G0007 [uncultured bacterium]|nr:MAG: hypothetical protein ACD_60C00005G0007 [uncultured bacterium]